MKKTVALLAALACLAIGFTAFATVPNAVATGTNAQLSELPQAPLFTAIAEFEGRFMSGTCKVIRPVATHSQCNYFLCESYGCGAPFDFDEVDCACYCGYAF